MTNKSLTLRITPAFSGEKYSKSIKRTRWPSQHISRKAGRPWVRSAECKRARASPAARHAAAFALGDIERSLCSLVKLVPASSRTKYPAPSAIMPGTGAPRCHRNLWARRSRSKASSGVPLTTHNIGADRSTRFSQNTLPFRVCPRTTRWYGPAIASGILA